MKSQSSSAAVAFLDLLALLANSAVAQEEAFTYQGRLTSSGGPANGQYEFQFRLADAATNGQYLGPTLTPAPVLVSNGLFTVVLDFGAPVFDGSARWLELGVRTNGSAEAFMTLQPRQSVTATPYALFAGTAAGATVATNLVAGATVVGNGAGLTNLNGAALQAGTVSSNALDAPTRAALSLGVSLAGLTNKITNLTEHIYNVRDFGAVGKNLALDSAAIANAFRAAYFNGGVLYFPPGNYYASNTLYFDGSGFRYSSVPGYRFRIKGDGVANSVVTFFGTNSSFMYGQVQIDLQDMAFTDGNYLNNLTNNCIWVNQDTGPTYIANCQFSYFVGEAVNLSGAAGVTINATSFEFNHIGLHLPGYCDGGTANVRIDGNDVGVELGGVATGFPGTVGVNGQRLHVVGAKNIYAVVIGPGLGEVAVSGYVEQSYAAVLTIGHPPDFYTPASDNGSYRRRVLSTLVQDGQIVVGTSFSGETRYGGWFRGASLSGTQTNYCALYIPVEDLVLNSQDVTTWSKNAAADASSLSALFCRGSFYASTGAGAQFNLNSWGSGHGHAEINPPIKNTFVGTTGTLRLSASEQPGLNEYFGKQLALNGYSYRSALTVLNTNQPFTIYAGGGNGSLNRPAFSLVAPLNNDPSGGARGLGVLEAFDAAPGAGPNLTQWGEVSQAEFSSMLNYGSTVVSGGNSVPVNVHAWWIAPTPLTTAPDTGVPAMVLHRNGSLHVGTNAAYTFNPLPCSLVVEKNVTSASLTVTGNVITNGGVVWLVTNNTPSGFYPAGSIATCTEGAAAGFYVQAVPGIWVLK